MVNGYAGLCYSLYDCFHKLNHFTLVAANKNTAPNTNGIQKKSRKPFSFFKIKYIINAITIHSNATREYIFFLFMFFIFIKLLFTNQYFKYAIFLPQCKR